MEWLRTMTDERLHETVRRLRRDIDDFTARANAQAASLERENRAVAGDPLHQRLTSIRDHLSEQLAQAQKEADRRARAAARRPGGPLRALWDGLLGARA